MKIVPAFLILLLVFSCQQKPAQPADASAAGKDSTLAGDSTTAYLPITDLIRQDIRQVDSFAGGILKKTTVNGKMDSVFVQPAALHQAAQVFLASELEPAVFRRSFTESSLMDETTGQVQFIYAPTGTPGQVQKAVAYVSPNSTGGAVTRVYLEKEWKAGDTSIHQKLTWKIRQYFYIITIRQVGQEPARTSIEKLIWDPEHFGG